MRRLDGPINSTSFFLSHLRETGSQADGVQGSPLLQRKLLFEHVLYLQVGRLPNCECGIMEPHLAVRSGWKALGLSDLGLMLDTLQYGERPPQPTPAWSGLAPGTEGKARPFPVSPNTGQKSLRKELEAQRGQLCFLSWKP